MAWLTSYRFKRIVDQDMGSVIDSFGGKLASPYSTRFY